MLGNFILDIFLSIPSCRLLRKHFFKFLISLLILSFFYSSAISQSTAYLQTAWPGTFSSPKFTTSSAILSGTNLKFTYTTIGATVPGDFSYTNSSGNTVTLSGTVDRNFGSGSATAGYVFTSNIGAISYILVRPGYESNFAANTQYSSSNGLADFSTWVSSQPSLTLNSISPICPTATTISIPYSSPSLSPDAYSIVWNVGNPSPLRCKSSKKVYRLLS
jgi:hypothetical protein